MFIKALDTSVRDGQGASVKPLDALAYETSINIEKPI